MAEKLTFQTNKSKWHEDGDGLWVSFSIQDRAIAIRAAQEVAEKQFDVNIQPHKKKRSLDANGYAWVLLDKLSAKLNVPKLELYRSFIKDVGGNSQTVCVINSAVEKLRAGWLHNGLGWLTEEMPSKLDGCTNVILYYGSSTYDTAQISRLINLIVEECKLQGIETMTPNELCKLKGLMDE